jgi:tRNA pseudouridine55 synthase
MNGILLVDKPTDWTSSDVVAKLRGLLHERRIGHSGTLDPMATGLLVLFVGRATRAVEFAESQEKRYLASLRLGLATDTQDITGNRISGEPREISEAELERTLALFRGHIQQIPPMYSAIKVGGKKLYEIARRGGEVERKPRPVHIRELKLLGREGEDWLLDVTCSKGTYIRTLCHDIGQSLGCGGCMSALRRVRAGEFSIENACTLDQVREAADRGEAEKLLLPVDSLFRQDPALSLNARDEKRIRSGGVFPVAVQDGQYRAYGPDGAFLALVRVTGGELKSIKSFFEV